MTRDDELKVNVASDSSIVILPFSIYWGTKEMNLFLNVQKVFRVVEAEFYDPLPENLAPMEGIYDMDGIPVPIIHLRKWLSPSFAEEVTMDSCRRAGRERLIIVYLQGAYIGILVDRTRKIRRQSNAEIYPPPEAIRLQESSFFNAVIKEEQGYRYMIDIEIMLSKLGVTLNEMDPTVKADQSLKGFKILVVEDSRLFQSLARKAFEKHGADIAIAENGQEGLEKLTASDERFDLVIADIEMPVMNGIEMIRKYKETSNSQVPVLFHSSISNPALAGDIRKDGLGDYLLKFEESHVLEKAKSILLGDKKQAA